MSVRPQGGRTPSSGGPLSESERTARYRARKREQEGRVPFNALITTEAMRQITEMCKIEKKRQAEVIEKAVAQSYARFTKRSGKV